MQGSDETEELTLEAGPAAVQRSGEMVARGGFFEERGDPDVFHFL